MKKEDIKQIFTIIFAISAVSLFTSVIMHFVFLEEFASYHWAVMALIITIHFQILFPAQFLVYYQQQL